MREIRHYLTFENNNDKVEFEHAIRMGKFVVMKITGRSIDKKYKFVMFTPHVNSRGDIYSSDIYQRVSHIMHHDVGIYTGRFMRCMEIVKILEPSTVFMTISDYYIGYERDTELADTLKSFYKVR